MFLNCFFKNKIFNLIKLFIMKAKFLLICAAALVAVSCGSSKNAIAMANQDIDVDVPCTGAAYSTSAEYFRANSMGMSKNLQMASQKAMTAARAELAAAIETTVKTVTDSYYSSYETDQTEELRGRFQTLTREVVNQKLNGIRVICEKTKQSPDGTYKSYVAIELAGVEIGKNIADKINADEKLRTDFEYQKFLEVFDTEMSAMGSK